MSEFIITCVKKDEHGKIYKVGIGDTLFDVEAIAEQIWNNRHSYFTNAMGIRVKVFAIRDPETNRPYLSTSPNIRLPNSLNFLPKCN